MNKQQKYSCAICELPDMNVYQLAIHIFKKHSISMEVYCRAYIFSSDIGTCPECGKPSKFLSIWRGFAKTCGSKECVESHKSKTMVRVRAETYDLKTALEKTRRTNKERYGVEHISHLESHMKKISDTNMRRYGTVSTLHLDNVSIARKTALKRPSVNEKRKNWWKTCGQSVIDRINKNRVVSNLEKYGVEYVSHLPEIVCMTRQRRVANGEWIPDDRKSDFLKYTKAVVRLTNNVRGIVLESWDGTDYYTGKPILGLTRNDWITIDHKISKMRGFLTGISPEELCQLDNLCVCSYSTNSKKNCKTESEFNEKRLSNVSKERT